MAYTEPNVLIGYVLNTIVTKVDIFRFVEFPQGERSGNQFTYFNAERPSTSLINADIIPPDKQNSTGGVQLYDYAARVPFTPSEYNTFQRFANAPERTLEKIEEALRIGMEVALDTAMVASTNTLSLTTDNTFTKSLFYQGMAKLSKYGVARQDVCFITSSELAAGTLMDAMTTTTATPLARMDDLRTVYGYAGDIPIFVDSNFTNDTGNGGTSAYLLGLGGVTAGQDGFNILRGQNLLTATNDIVGTLAYGFTLTKGASDPRIVRYTNV